MDPEHRKTSTRERITAGALALFNQRGASRATTAEIAAAADMREGNLHYHFARKEQLIEALYEQFETAALALASRPIDGPRSLRSYHDYQRAWFELMSDYRCFYRDGVEMLEMAPGLRERVADLRVRTLSLTRRMFETAIELGVMRIEPAALTKLLDNVWIVSSFWMSYRRQNQPEPSDEDLEWGFGQVSALFAPYLSSGDPEDSGGAGGSKAT